jgi:hypothetical protein
MFHRILKTFFFIQVATEYVVESVVQLGEEAYEETKSKFTRKRRQSYRKAHEQRNGSKRTHTFKDLPPKFGILARQFSRYVTISFLGLLLGKN